MMSLDGTIDDSTLLKMLVQIQTSEKWNCDEKSINLIITIV